MTAHDVPNKQYKIPFNRSALLRILQRYTGGIADSDPDDYTVYEIAEIITDLIAIGGLRDE